MNLRVPHDEGMTEEDFAEEDFADEDIDKALIPDCTGVNKPGRKMKLIV